MEPILHLPDSLGLHRISKWHPIAGDASGRRYWRVEIHEGGTAILCRYPERWRSIVKRDLEVLLWLHDRGMPVPRILSGDAQSLWVLLEDLGAIDGEQALARTAPEARVELAGKFLEPLCRLSTLSVTKLPHWNPSLDQAFLRWELNGFEMWSLSEMTRQKVGTVLQPWLDELAASVAEHPRSICLRDYHLNNILVDAKGGVGIIDVQDLRQGPDTYDLASLLSDRAMPEILNADERLAVAQLWADSVGVAPGWERRLEEATLQRTLKVLGTFAFLSAKGMPQYLRWVPRTASTAAEIAERLGAPAGVKAILLELAATGGVDVW